MSRCVKKRLFGVHCLFASGFVCLVAFGFVLLSASGVAGFAGWDHVVNGVCASSVVFYNVVGFGCDTSAPVAGWVVL
jgi:hypothetical protein